MSPCIRQVTHALLTRPPLGNIKSIRKLHSYFLVRLACVKHAASVHPEPGSNSHLKMWFVPARIFILAFPFLPMSRFCSFSENLFGGFSILRFLEFSGLEYTVYLSRFFCCRLGDSLFILSQLVVFVNNFFYLFFAAFCCFSAATRLSYQNLLSLSTTFLIILNFLL